MNKKFLVVISLYLIFISNTSTFENYNIIKKIINSIKRDLIFNSMFFDYRFPEIENDDYQAYYNDFYLDKDYFYEEPIIGFWGSWKVQCGIAIYSEHLVNEISNLGYKVFAYDNKTKIEDFIKQIKEDNVNILNIQYEPSLFHHGNAIFSNINEFVNFVENLQQMGIKIVLTVHFESEIIKDLIEIADQCIYLRPSVLFNLEKINVIPIGAPVFNPENDPKEIRKKYGFSDDDIILTTTGFMLPPKQNSEILNELSKSIKLIPNLKIQLLTSFNNSQPFLKHVSNIEFEKIQNVIKTNQIENQVIHITDFLSQQELNERLWISDLGYLWGDETATASSASIKEFISSRLPLVITNCHRFSNDSATEGFIKTEVNQTIFAETLIKTITDKNTLEQLRKHLEKKYLEINNQEVIKEHINVYYKALFYN